MGRVNPEGDLRTAAPIGGDNFVLVPGVSEADTVRGVDFGPGPPRPASRAEAERALARAACCSWSARGGIIGCIP